MSLQSMLRRALTFNHLPKSVLPSGLRARRPYASSNSAAAAEEPNPDGNKVRGRRLSKKELHARVETFVNEYKAMNAGKFPPITYTQKQVGGSYYRIRGILQELQYAAKMSPSGGKVEHSSGREGTRGSESLTVVVGVSAQTVSEVEDVVDLGVVSDGSLAKEESMMSSSVEIVSEVVVTPGRGSDLDVTQTNIGKVAAAESSYIVPDIVGNDMEEHTKHQSVFIAPGHEILEGGSEVNSLSRDTSHDSKTEEAHADKHVYVSEVKHLQMGDNNTASLSSDNMEDVNKPDFEECKMKQHEDIPQSEVISHSRDKSHDCKTEEPQADKHDYVSEVNNLQLGDNNTASLSSDDIKDVSKPDLEVCKMKQHEEIPQFDRLDPIPAENHVPLEADKVSKDLSVRPAAHVEPPKTTLWGAMKSLADGIISIFRKQ